LRTLRACFASFAVKPLTLHKPKLNRKVRKDDRKGRKVLFNCFHKA